MSRNGTLLPIPEGSDLELRVQAWVSEWPEYERSVLRFPRSAWLGALESRILHPAFPQSSSADRKLTARHYAPFPLRDGHDVP